MSRACKFTGYRTASAAVEVAGDETLHEGVVGEGRMGLVGVVAAQAGHDAVERAGREYAALLEDAAHGLQAVGRLGAVDGQTGQGGETVGVLGAVDVDVDVGALGHLEGIGHLKAVACGYSEGCEQLVDVGRAVGAADFECLLLRGVDGAGAGAGIGHGAHIGAGRPAQRHAHKHGAVAVAPAHVGGRFLVGHQAEVARGVGVAEGGEGGSQRHDAGDGAARGVAETAVGIEHHVMAVAGDAHVDVQARAGLAGGDLGREGDVVAQAGGEVAYHPLGQHELVGGLLGVDGQELNLVLLVVEAAEGEVAHLAVAVLDASARAGYVAHAQRAEIVVFGKGAALVIALLVGGGELSALGRYHIVLELAHSLEAHARDALKFRACLVERVLRRALERPAVLVEERAEHSHRRQLGEGVDESRAEARQHVEVGAAGADEGEERRAVDALAQREDGLKIVEVVDYEIQRLQTSVAGGVHEVDHLDTVLGDETYDVVFRKFFGGLAESRHNLVLAESDMFVHDIKLTVGTAKLNNKRVTARLIKHL